MMGRWLYDGLGMGMGLRVGLLWRNGIAEGGDWG